MRVMDGLEAFPSILLAIAIMATLGPSTENVIVALSVVYTPNIARLVRGTTLMNKQQTYVESARAIGMRRRSILRRYIFMNSLSPLIVQATFVVAFAILTEASLSFLGAGVPPDTPTWGSIVSSGQPRLQQAWWISVFPRPLPLRHGAGDQPHRRRAARRARSPLAEAVGSRSPFVSFRGTRNLAAKSRTYAERLLPRAGGGMGRDKRFLAAARNDTLRAARCSHQNKGRPDSVCCRQHRFAAFAGRNPCRPQDQPVSVCRIFAGERRETRRVAGQRGAAGQ